MTSRTRARRTAAHRVARTTGWLTVSSLIVTAALAPAVQAAKPVGASTPVVGPLHYGSGITIDGDRAGWTSLDRYADMFRAAKADKPVESTLYLRYDCTAGTLAVMVETVDGVVLETGGDHFVKVDGSKQVGSPDIGDFTVSPDDKGWEASFAIAEGDYALNVHAQVLDGGSQTSAVEGRDIPLSVDCPADEPSQAPSEDPTQTPSEAPSEEPSVDPSEAPSEEPSVDPSEAPSEVPSEAPSDDPTQAPSEDPTQAPSDDPSVEPSQSVEPSEAPSEAPSEDPTQAPSQDPSVEPSQSVDPSQQPTDDPSAAPSQDPSVEPTQSVDPTQAPTDAPSQEPTATPTTQPSGGVAGATGTPQLTPPPTDTLGSPMAPASEGWRLALLGLAGLIAAALLLGAPREPARRR